MFSPQATARPSRLLLGVLTHQWQRALLFLTLVSERSISLILSSSTCCPQPSISHFLLCTPHLLMPLWVLDCNDNHWPLWSLIGEGFLWKQPPTCPHQFHQPWWGFGVRNAFLFLENLHCELSYVLSSNHKSHFVSIKMMRMNEMFPKSLWEIIHDVGPWF